MVLIYLIKEAIQFTRNLRELVAAKVLEIMSRLLF